jgi:hypothetical protein
MGEEYREEDEEREKEFKRLAVEKRRQWDLLEISGARENSIDWEIK